MITLNKPNYSMCSIALTYPAKSHFQRTLNKERRTRIGMNVTAHQEKEKNKKTGNRKAGEERNRPILKRLSAILLRSFRGLHGEKMVGVRGAPRVTGTLGKTNSQLNPTQTKLRTAPPR